MRNNPEMTPEELEIERRKYDLFGRNEEFVPIEDFSSRLSDGDYAIVCGKKVSMRIYGEKIVEETEQWKQ